MATAELTADPAKSLKDPEFIARLQELRQADNITNVYYLARTWLYLTMVIGGTIWFYQYQAANSLSWWWNAPVTLVAIVLVGAGQHHLTGLAHEASHHVLLKHRLLNDLVSDWFCMFPMFSSTHHYRLQHLAHHQFVNDPDRDPDVSQLKTSGHWLRFPIEKAQFVWTLVKQLWIPNLIKYIRVRAQYNSMGTTKNPYLKKGWKPSKLPVRVGILYMLAQIGLLTTFTWRQNDMMLALIPGMLWLAAMVFYATIPAELYHQSRVKPVVSSRVMTLTRISFITALFCSLAWITRLTGHWAALYFFGLWLVPMFTSFSFFMVLRQLVQHGNGGRGFLTNTRVFFVSPFLNFAVFPFGQDYHLPHHMFASVPHYRLKDLHELLLGYPEYREHAVVVEGYFMPIHHPQEHPTVLDVLGPGYPGVANRIYIDSSVLEDDEVDEKDAILREAMIESTASESVR